MASPAIQLPATDRPEQQDDEPRRVLPDEDGPHDVPDDEVIEETLPSRPTPKPTAAS